MRLLSFVFCLLSFVLVVGCTSTPYQSSGARGGFSELKIKDDVWRVSFGGNGFTTRETVQTYWLYRAAELTLEKGYDGFEIISGIHLSQNVLPRNSVDLAELPVKKTAFIYIPMPDDSRKPWIEADIRLLKAPITAAPPRLFDAKAIKEILSQYVNGKKCDLNNTTGNVCPHIHDYLELKSGGVKPPV